MTHMRAAEVRTPGGPQLVGLPTPRHRRHGQEHLDGVAAAALTGNRTPRPQVSPLAAGGRDHVPIGGANRRRATRSLSRAVMPSRERDAGTVTIDPDTCQDGGSCVDLSRRGVAAAARSFGHSYTTASQHPAQGWIGVLSVHRA